MAELTLAEMEGIRSRVELHVKLSELGFSPDQCRAIAHRGGTEWLREVVLAELDGPQPSVVVSFSFFGRPQGKKSVRRGRRGAGKGLPITHVPDDQQHSYAGIAGAFQNAAPPHWLPWPCAVVADVACYMRQPATWCEGSRCLKKPDWDNVGKLLGDSLNGVAYIDDSQIDDGRVRKTWTSGMERTFVRLEFWPIPAGQLLAQTSTKACVKQHLRGHMETARWHEAWVTPDTLDAYRQRIARMAS